MHRDTDSYANVSARNHARNHAGDARGKRMQRGEREQMGRKIRNSVLQHELFILSKNIPNVSRTIVPDKREDRQMEWARSGGRKEGREG